MKPCNLWVFAVPRQENPPNSTGLVYKPFAFRYLGQGELEEGINKEVTLQYKVNEREEEAA